MSNDYADRIAAELITWCTVDEAKNVGWYDVLVQGIRRGYEFGYGVAESHEILGQRVLP